jgi:hypothetical protein
MNILKIQDDLKSVPDQALVGYVQNPTGQVPTYLALSELQRRKDMRAKAQSAQPSKTTVAQDVAQPAPQPMPQPQAQPQAGVAALPVPDQMFNGQGMAQGGIVAFADGGDTESHYLDSQAPLNLETGSNGGGYSNPSYGMDQLRELVAFSGSPYFAQLYRNQNPRAQGNPLTSDVVGKAEGGEVATSKFGDWMRGLGNVDAADIDKQIGALQREKNKYQFNVFTPKTPSQKVNEAARIQEIDSQISQLTSQRNKTAAPSVAPSKDILGSQAAADSTIRGSLGTPDINAYVPPSLVQNKVSPTGVPPATPSVGDVGIASALPKPMTLDEAINREKEAYTKMGVDPEFYAKQVAKLNEDREALKADKSQAGWMALAKAGLGMAAGKSPFALQNIATGAMQGVEQYGMDVKDIKKEQNLLKASDQKLAEAQYLQSRGDAQGALKAMDERDKLIQTAQQHRDTVNATIQAAKIGAASRSGIDEDTIAKGFAKAVENGEYKNTPEDYLRYKSLFTSAGALPTGVTVTKNK